MKTNTIKFKLTLWYSLFTLILGLILVVIFNLYISFQFEKPIFNENNRVHMMINSPFHKRWVELNQRERDLVQEFRNNDLQYLRNLSLFSIIPIVLLSFSGGYILADKMLKPLQNLNNKISEIQEKNLDQKIEIFADDEIGDLTKSFNQMLERLDLSFKNQVEFIQNASHEINTPLTSLNLYLDEIEESQTVSEKEKLTRKAKNKIFEINQLFENLLLLSTIEKNFDEEKVNLSQLFKSIVNDLAPLAKSKSIKIKLDIDTHYSVTGNVEFTKILFKNLLDNSIKYSNNNDFVEIIQKNNSILIKDRGKGLSAEEKKRIFERFYRVDSSRSKEIEGYGLGLSIVKKIADLHKWEITVLDNKPKGTVIKVSFN